MCAAHGVQLDEETANGEGEQEALDFTDVGRKGERSLVVF